GALAARSHVEVGAEHGFAEDGQLRRAHRQSDGERSDDRDFRLLHRPPVHDAMARARIASSLIAVPVSSPVIRPPRNTRTRAAFVISSGISEEIMITATPSVAMPRKME